MTDEQDPRKEVDPDLLARCRESLRPGGEADQIFDRLLAEARARSVLRDLRRLAEAAAKDGTV